MLSKHKVISGLSSAVAGVGLLFIVSSPAVAAGTPQEIATAIQHLQLAVLSKDIKTVHMHMQHAINCLAGPKGWGFDASQIDPCKNQGNGAIPDTTDAAKKNALEGALAQIVSGLSEDNLGWPRRMPRTMPPCSRVWSSGGLPVVRERAEDRTRGEARAGS